MPKYTEWLARKKPRFTVKIRVDKKSCLTAVFRQYSSIKNRLS